MQSKFLGKRKLSFVSLSAAGCLYQNWTETWNIFDETAGIRYSFHARVTRNLLGLIDSGCNRVYLISKQKSHRNVRVKFALDPPLKLIVEIQKERVFIWNDSISKNAFEKIHTTKKAKEFLHNYALASKHTHTPTNTHPVTKFGLSRACVCVCVCVRECLCHNLKITSGKKTNRQELPE